MSELLNQHPFCHITEESSVRDPNPLNNPKVLLILLGILAAAAGTYIEITSGRVAYGLAAISVGCFALSFVFKNTK